MKQKYPLLSFEFADSYGQIRPYTFKNPIRIIEAQRLEDVIPTLQLVQKAVEDGYYAAGFLSYESAAAFDLANTVKSGNTMPFLWFGIFSEPEFYGLESSGEYTLTEWQPSVSKNEYAKAIQSIKESIEDGVTYQTNYTIRLHSQFKGDDLAFFNRLKNAQASHYCAYLNTGEYSILSASPELFFHLKGDRITTRPMKGTIKRGNTYLEDGENASWLYHSEKDRAENVMIVDLLRNDLGMIAEPGSVKVEKLFNIEHYPTVHQMTSTILAKVSEDMKLVDIFKALFPCGSITGAPKISTMKVIADLESTPREVYCGAIGFISPNKEAVFNVPIRTVMIDHQSGKASYGVGGGITWDSTVEGEYHEILAKAKLLKEKMVEFQLLESVLLEDGKYFLLEKHLTRLAHSAQYFGFDSRLEEIRKRLDVFSSENDEGLLKVRLLVKKDGEIKIEGQPITQMDTPLKVILADEPIDKNHPFLYHKTTNREIYTKFHLKKPVDVFDVLLWNQDEELTEFTNGNVVVEINGLYWTPPISSGLLAGTFRDSLIENGEIREKIIKLEDLKTCTRAWFVNSVRKWIEVEFPPGTMGSS
nr:aminodeoxychorismate synthase component I [Neobacillus sp. Marseille-Q6967]